MKETGGMPNVLLLHDEENTRTYLTVLNLKCYIKNWIMFYQTTMYNEFCLNISAKKNEFQWPRQMEVLLAWFQERQKTVLTALFW